MNIHYLQHVPFEGLGSIEQWAARRGDTVSVSRLYQGDALPALNAFDLLIIMGGPMDVYDEQEYAWLAPEKRWIAAVISAGKRALGICFGAQLIAAALGANVRHNPCKEIGWFPLDLTDNGRQSRLFKHISSGSDVFHWHGDTFDLPDGAEWIARSAACEHQAFVYRQRVIGLQFHLESTAQSVGLLIENCQNELVDAPFIQSGAAMLARPERFARINALMNGLLDEFAAP